MGIYVYALNTKIHSISSVTLGVAEFRYKEHTTMFEGEKENAKLYNRLRKRRVAHFEKNKLPFYFVMGKFKEGMIVFDHLSQKGRVVGSCFDDGVPLKRVGLLTKEGRNWTIKWD